ncbi:uncharacterized protein LOC136083801 [Hydra vulgaris]|uniref:Uncharacterized protein LOC136083801 n=1 Tax=Hydra vulgaris TaxID=6087 RepID=A0ABM4CDD2_HYDVU
MIEQDNEDEQINLFDQTEIPLFSSQPLITNDGNLSTSITAIEKRFAVLERKSFELLTSIQYEIKKINSKISNIEKLLSSNLIHGVAVTQSSIPFLEWNCLPMQTEEEVVVLECKLEDKDNLESLIRGINTHYRSFKSLNPSSFMYKMSERMDDWNLNHGRE